LDQWNKEHDKEYIEEDDYDEEGGEDEYNELEDNIPLTEEMKEKLRAQGIDPDQYEDYGDEDFDDEYGEEEMDEEEGEAEMLGKREREDGQEDDAEKRQK
jgi:hypothetical protein